MDVRQQAQPSESNLVNPNDTTVFPEITKRAVICETKHSESNVPSQYGARPD